MPGAARLNDTCTGHGCWPPRVNIQASNGVFVNGRGAHRKTDAWQEHCCDGCHGGRLAQGSPNVFVDGLQLGRCSDPVDCGSSVATCSNNVMVN